MAETLNQRWSAHLVGALWACGVRDAVIAPGSRSTPLALALADHGGIRCSVIIDERSAGFFGLGLAKASRAPVALLCTSGTAGAHLLPAIMEAFATGVPLVVLTADRPWELHGFGAPQTAEQSGLFTGFVRARELLPAPDEDPASLEHVVAVTARALHLACRAPQGPVHLNVAFREPLAPPDGGPTPRATAHVPAFTSPRAVPDLTLVADALRNAERPLVVCGPREADGLAPSLHELAERLGAPVLAEAASNARFGFPQAIATYDALLRHEGFAASARPDVVLRFGGGLTSKVLQQWLDGSGSTARTFVFPESGGLVDPAHRAEAFIAGSLDQVRHGLEEVQTRARGFRERWASAQERVEAALANGMAVAGGPEVLAARELALALPRGASLVVSSSMPIRDLDAYATRSQGPLRVFANRGVNGIDGVTSTALGVAAALGGKTALLTGDLALLHDLSALVAARKLGLSLTIVVTNNDGGGIFGFLPVAARTRHYERLFGTPHGVDLSHAAGLGGATLHRPADVESYRRALAVALEGGLHLVELASRRDENVELHRALNARLAQAGGDERC
ncbi:MAG: 2-succinyl-5-enolpyruvyl-6-hydroxy-3-cyclohexene-1-carboxylic-acid synthase [Deltaproteobacteria bacterium]|nr:2-succinyl-5-enolpyruvyl-6-hydroxy-3-cyclohexene-1-carboxylic-acid synthase [Deltaproteobacteria bacterium]